jgi:hypothetical protein
MSIKARWVANFGVLKIRDAVLKTFGKHCSTVSL